MQGEGSVRGLGRRFRRARPDSGVHRSHPCAASQDAVTSPGGERGVVPIGLGPPSFCHALAAAPSHLQRVTSATCHTEVLSLSTQWVPCLQAVGHLVSSAWNMPSVQPQPPYTYVCTNACTHTYAHMLCLPLPFQPQCGACGVAGTPES